MKTLCKAVRTLILCFAIVMLTGNSIKVHAAEETDTTITVNTDALRVRQNPSLQAKCLGHVNTGNMLRYIDTVDDEWIAVDYNGVVAYIAARYVTINCMGPVEEQKTVQTSEQLVTEAIVLEESAPVMEQTAENESAAEEIAAIESTEETAVAEPAAEEIAAIEITEETAVAEPAAEEIAATESTEETAVAEPAAEEIPGTEITEETAVTEPAAVEITAAETEQGTATVAAAETQQTAEAAAIAESAPAAEQTAEAAVSAAVAETVPAQVNVLGEEAVPLAAAVTEDSEAVMLLAALIQCEAGGECYEGQVAVGAVVMNRVADPRFPNTMEEVIYQPGQFTPVKRGKLDRVLAGGNIYESCIEAAKEALSGVSNVGNCTRFRRGTRPGGIVIQHHVFY